MKKSIVLLVVTSVLSSCNQNPTNKIPVVGSLDSVAIAQDTTMQLGFESSYEFHKSLPVNENLVFDVVGYGGSASKGEFAILRRGADNKTDTVIKQNRNGMITDAYLDDSKEEVFLVVQKPGDSSSTKTLRFNLRKDRLLNPK